MDATLLGVLIGGIFTIVGTVIGSLTSNWAAREERKERRREFLREKLEELSEMTSLAAQSAIKLSECHTLEEVRDFTFLEHSRKAHLLSILYFPNLKDPTTVLHNALIRYHGTCVDISDRVRDGQTIGGALTQAGIGEQIADVLRGARQALDDAVEKEAPKVSRV